jgi:hypothetical protein
MVKTFLRIKIFLKQTNLPFTQTLTKVTRSFMFSTTSVMAKYSRTFLQIRMIFLISDSSKAKSSADVP